jgi:hypothetical protein
MIADSQEPNVAKTETRRERFQAMLEEAKADVERVEGNRTALDVSEKFRVTELRRQTKEARQKYLADRKAMTDQLKGFRHEVALIAGSLKEHKPMEVAPAAKKTRKTRKAQQTDTEDVNHDPRPDELARDSQAEAETLEH